MKKVILWIVIAIVAIIVLSGIGALIWYNSCLKPVSKSEETIRVEIEKDSGVSKIASVLEENKVIKSAFAMKIYAKLNNTTNLQAGKYDFHQNEDLATIISRMQKGDIVNDEVNITFIEGKNMRLVAKRISEYTNNTEEDVFELLEDEEYIDSLIEKYWFLTDDIKNKDIYYPLEGYLLPDTYTFENKDVSVKTIFNILLNFMDKALTEYKEDISNSGKSVHEILTLASMAELEAESEEDRSEVVGVFLNRISKKMSLGSDVTTYYAFKVDMNERDLTKKELNTENPYNTRGPNMSAKLPIGPICNPSVSAIKAAIYPKKTTALYFVSDKNNKTYFSNTYEEQEKVIKELKSKGLWYTY